MKILLVIMFLFFSEILFAQQQADIMILNIVGEKQYKPIAGVLVHTGNFELGTYFLNGFGGRLNYRLLGKELNLGISYYLRSIHYKTILFHYGVDVSRIIKAGIFGDFKSIGGIEFRLDLRRK
jgi:hypothetical protein